MITVVTSTIGRPSLLKLVDSLSKQNISITHLLFWDKNKEENGIVPYDNKLDRYTNENYNIFHYDIKHPVSLQSKSRIDNYMRIVGVSMSTTEYITSIDDDCWVENNWFKNAIDVMQKDNLDYCYCRRYIWENDHNKLGFDNYESIGNINIFGYYLMDLNTIIYIVKKYNYYCYRYYIIIIAMI